MTIRAPYNFVPLNEVVFTPPHDDRISHDIPFSDGESGWIQIKLTATSPVFVRNGGDWSENNSERNANPAYQSFSRFNSRYFIPATSIKGMVRNVLEIMSFGKMEKKKRINDHKLSYRDLSVSTEGNYYKQRITTTINSVFTPKVKAGWLKERADGSWNLTPCEFARVEHGGPHGLIKYYDSDIDLKSHQSSANKYRKWLKREQLELSFSFLRDLDTNDIIERYSHTCGELAYKKAVNLKKKGQGAIDGTLVFTGQPSGKKHMEFIFHSPASAPINISDQLKEDFLFIHSESNGLPNPELHYMTEEMDKLRNGKMPVFYLVENKKIQ